MNAVAAAALEPRIRAACDQAQWAEATTLAVQGYGPELLGYLIGMARDEAVAGEAFSLLCENLWRGLPAFRWESTYRTWAYCLARRSFTRLRRDPRRKREIQHSDALTAAVAEVRSRTATFLRTETKDKVAALRATLAPDDQTLLILRINRKLPWREIAIVLGDDDDEPPAAVERRAAALRKRFERIKLELRALVKPSGEA